MKAKYFIAAAALFASSGVSAKPLDTIGRAAAPVRMAAASRHAVLDNIIGRVQMDALIGTIVASDVAKPSRAPRAVAYAAVNTAKLRDRS